MQIDSPVSTGRFRFNRLRRMAGLYNLLNMTMTDCVFYTREGGQTLTIKWRRWGSTLYAINKQMVIIEGPETEDHLR
jgi:hypothetical protein